MTSSLRTRAFVQVRSEREDQRSSDGSVGGVAGSAEGIVGTDNGAVSESVGSEKRIGERAESGGRRLPHQAQVHSRASDSLLESDMVLREDQSDEPSARSLVEQRQERGAATSRGIGGCQNHVGQRTTAHGSFAHVSSMETEFYGGQNVSWRGSSRELHLFPLYIKSV